MPRFTDIRDLIQSATTILAAFIPVVIGLCFVAFFWGTGKFIKKSGESSDRQDTKHYLIYGIAGIFIITSLFGLAALISNFINPGVDTVSSGFTTGSGDPFFQDKGTGGNTFYKPGTNTWFK